MSDGLRIAVRPLTLDEYGRFSAIIAGKYRRGLISNKSLRLVCLAVSWVVAFVFVLGLTSFDMIFVPLPAIRGYATEFTLNGGWLVGFACLLIVSEWLYRIAVHRAIHSRMLASEWAARSKTGWHEARFDRRGITIEGTLATVFHAWPLMTAVRFEAGLILAEAGDAVLLAIPGAELSADERDWLIAYGNAQIAEAPARLDLSRRQEASSA